MFSENEDLFVYLCYTYMYKATFKTVYSAMNSVKGIKSVLRKQKRMLIEAQFLFNSREFTRIQVSRMLFISLNTIMCK